MAYEIDFLPVGEKSSGGDAIAIRWGGFGPGTTTRDRYVAVVDGGHAETGDRLAEHIQKRFGTSHIDVMVSTHPDNDHIRGLITLMERDDITVGRLWMHKPWEHSTKAAMAKYTAAFGETKAKTFDDYIANAKKLYDLAQSRNTPVDEPFTGLSIADHGGALTVVGPNSDYYRGLVPGFGTAAARADLGRSIQAFLQKSANVLTRAREDLWTETLTDSGSTTPANNSSVVLVFRDGDHRALLTGDAGIAALTDALPAIESECAGTNLDFVQVPHHGSRHNVGPTLLDRILGPKGTLDARGTAFCSCPAENPDARHPAKMVTNAFARRGYPVHSTAGSIKWHHSGAPPRLDFVASHPEPFHHEVENFDDE